MQTISYFRKIETRNIYHWFPPKQLTIIYQSSNLRLENSIGLDDCVNVKMCETAFINN